MNLWEETLKELRFNGKTFDDVNFVYGKDFQITKENFENVAKKTEYHHGYGAQEIASDLKLQGTDFILERREYDGSEWWEIIFIDGVPKNIKKISKLKGGCWESLKEINEEEK